MKPTESPLWEPVLATLLGPSLGLVVLFVLSWWVNG